MKILDENTGQILGQKVGILYVDEYKGVLTDYKKVATARTIRSISYEIIIRSNGVRIKIQADKGLFFIESGRKKGGKLPVRKTADGFELFPRLQEWVEAVGYGGSHYLLAKGISERGIKGIPITEIVLQQIAQEVDRLVVNIVREEVVQNLIRELKIIYNK